MPALLAWIAPALYFGAAATGLRAGTLRAVKINQYHLDEQGRNAYVQVLASQLKDAEDLTIPISPDAASFLKDYFKDKEPSAHAFTFPGIHGTVRMLRWDLKQAGIKYCDEKDGKRTNVKDFHSLRRTFGMRCAKAGVPLAVLQKWMGHSDPALTSNIYLDSGLADDPAMVAKLPSILQSPAA